MTRQDLTRLVTPEHLVKRHSTKRWLRLMASRLSSFISKPLAYIGTSEKVDDVAIPTGVT